MYSQDNPNRYPQTTLKTPSYHLQSTLTPTSLSLHLKTPPSDPSYHRYTTTLTLPDLQLSLHDKFDDLRSLQLFLSDQNNINVDMQTGVIELVINVLLMNGKNIVTKLGEVRLREEFFDVWNCVQHVLQLVEGQEGKEGQAGKEGWIRDCVRELGNMVLVLFKRVQSIQQTINGSDREAFYSFKSNSGKNIKHNSNSPSRHNHPQHPKQPLITLFQQPHPYPYPYPQPQLNSIPQSIPSSNHPSPKLKPFCTKQQFQALKKELLQKISVLGEKQEKEELETSILEVKVEEIGRTVRGDIQELRKKVTELGELGDLRRLGEMGRVEREGCDRNLGNLENRRSGLKMIRLVESSSLNEKQLSLDSDGGHSAIEEDIKLLRTQFQDFSEAVITKIQNLGKSNQLFQDKLQRIISQLDLRLQQKILQQSIEQLHTKILDMQSPNFHQFLVQGTQIQYKGEDSLSTILLSKIKISQKNTFSIKIVQSLVNNIQIGLIDGDCRGMRDCWGIENFILYVGWNSTIFQGPSDLVLKEGEPIGVGDVVTVRANLDTGLIQWMVAGEVRAKVVWDKLKDKSINWVPMVRFYDHGDIITWMTDKMLRI